jgi:hypothetical protein
MRSPTFDIRESFGALRFSTFSTISVRGDIFGKSAFGPNPEVPLVEAKIGELEINGL